MVEIQELIDRRYVQGSTVVNCITHYNLSLLERPVDCKLCNTDIKNTLNRCVKVNEFLNTWKDDATKILDAI